MNEGEYSSPLFEVLRIKKKIDQYIEYQNKSQAKMFKHKSCVFHFISIPGEQMFNACAIKRVLWVKAIATKKKMCFFLMLQTTKFPTTECLIKMVPLTTCLHKDI